MLCFDSNNSRPILWVKVVERSREETSTSTAPPPPIVDDTSTEYDCMDGDEWDNSEHYKEEVWRRPILWVKVVERSREETSTSTAPPPPIVDDTSTEYDCMDGDEWDNSEHYKEEVWRRLGYWKCWMAGVTAKNIVQGTPDHGHVMMPDFSYVFNGLNPRSIDFLMVDEESSRFIYYFMAFGASIHGYVHMRKVVAVNGMHLSGKFSLFVLPCGQGIHIGRINDYFNDLKERCPSAAACLEHNIGFEKWSRVNFPDNQFDFMTTNIIESLSLILLDEKEHPVEVIFNSIAHRFGEISRKRYIEVDNSRTSFVPLIEKIFRENMTKGDKLYVNNINKSTDDFTMLGNPAVLKTSRTDNNSGKKFYSCAVGKDNGGCSYFKWIFSDFKESKFQGVATFEMLERRRDFEENMDIFMTLFRESKHKSDHLKGLLKDVEIERDQLKHRLAMVEEKRKGHDNYGVWFAISFGLLERCNGV
ncbi:hypothetical protein CQW23_02425 [Capsicum baccatum]|uniref:GRF-type domain-containing protein n=1 Tax=Capsicum baccatum TaxID=33114 RepID=A0A2G2XRF6_CAPBA|nr:hypothetical protein CQW23_02425 [Capsicum baccatum]